MLESMGIIIGAVSALLGIGTFFHQLILSKRADKKPLERLLESLDKGRTITTPEELEYQVRHSVRQKFVCDGKDLSLKDLSRRVWKLSGKLYVITGKPASGKSTALRKLYCQMAKEQKRIKCIFFNMSRIAEDGDLREYLSELIIINKLEKNDEIVAFFDGVDEAISFMGNERFCSLFLKGAQSQIFNFFKEKELNLRGMVFSIRTEFFERAENGLISSGSSEDRKYHTKCGNYYMEVFKLKEMSKRDVVKIYKSLKVLKELDRKRPEEFKRHQNKYPERKGRRKYLKLFKRIVNDKQSVFYYPMYVRYAYIYMQEYEKEWDPYRGDIRMSSNNMVSAVEILINAIIKWEYHVYDSAYSGRVTIEKEVFSRNMRQYLDDVIDEMERNRTQEISRARLKDILESHSLNTEDDDQKIMPVFSHSFMVSDENGRMFAFAHFIFYEYFLAKYLIYKAEYEQRERYFLSDTTKNFLHIYYEMLCKDKNLNEKILRSLREYGLKCFLEKRPVVEVAEEPKASILEIHGYLPYIKECIYRGYTFTKGQLEEIRNTRTLDIRKTGWDSIKYAKAIAPLEYVKELNLSGLLLINLNGLEEYVNLERLDMRIAEISAVTMEDMLDALRNRSLQWLYISTSDGAVCEELNDMMGKGELSIGKVYADTPTYSEAHRRIYHLKQQASQENKFYICTRSGWSEARLEYDRSNKKKKPDLLKAVFELEADGDGLLGLAGAEAEPTYWNGLALAEYYLYGDTKQRKRESYDVCSRLEPYMPMNQGWLNAYFGKIYGVTLLWYGETDRAKPWLMNTWEFCQELFQGATQNARDSDERDKIISVGLQIYREYLSCRVEGAEKIGGELLDMIKTNTDYQENRRYLLYLDYSLGSRMRTWEKGTGEPEGLMEGLQDFYKKAERYAEKTNTYRYLVYAFYYLAVYANRMEDMERAPKMLEGMRDAMQKEGLEETDRTKQAQDIMYWEQEIYHLLLKDDREELLQVVDELEKYRYRICDKPKKNLEYIRKVCPVKTEEEDIDRHIFWNSVWY